VRGVLLQPASLIGAFRGVDTAFYLVHSMNGGERFEAEDRRAASNFADAARQAGVRRIIYLGGLAHGASLSPHMRSRAETGNILRASGLSVIELKSSIVIGSGSASFEVIRALVERLPVMTTPRWVSTAAQPIAVEDVIEYLVAAARLPARGNLTFEIGGADVTSYVGIMREYARQRNLHRWFLPVPFLSLSLSSRWLTLITPVYAAIGRCLIESVRNPSVVENPSALAAFDIRPMGIARAIQRALTNEDRDLAETRWSDAWARAAGYPDPSQPSRDLLVNEQSVRVHGPPRRPLRLLSALEAARGGTSAIRCGRFAA
jgi:uncharacterized protein YbjT (DUF2867 family)